MAIAAQQAMAQAAVTMAMVKNTAQTEQALVAMVAASASGRGGIVDVTA